MDINKEELFVITGRLISCIVSNLIYFRIIDARYIRTYHSEFLYIMIKMVCCLGNLAVYTLNSPVVNVAFWILIIIITSKFFYKNEKNRQASYYLINIALFFLFAVCESIGGLAVRVGVKFLGIIQGEEIISFVYTLGGSLSVILMYYLVIQKLFTAERTKKISSIQYLIYAIITAYVLINIGSILFLLQHELTNKDYLFLLLDGVFVIIINLYLFYLLDTFSENKELKYKILLYEKLAQEKYDYYAKQMENNKKALRVIHDIRKHIRVLEGLNQTNISTQLKGYTDSFEEMIEPLLVKQYTNSAIFNILIKDKIEYCERNSIQFKIDIGPVDMQFMKPIDITTLFGNILDNAVEACEKSEKKEIQLKMYPFNGLCYVELSNTYEKEVYRNSHGRPISLKGEHHGIGLVNVEKVLHEYNGEIQYIVTQELFTVELMFSKK